ncbi:MAG: hypothetical protein QF792_04980, partial [Phycisphaerae bacterium]|nr:hypothetical protein [Phycisphaerae bacterium]
ARGSGRTEENILVNVDCRHFRNAAGCEIVWTHQDGRPIVCKDFTSPYSEPLRRHVQWEQTTK